MSDIELTSAQKRKIKRAVTALNDARKELQHENPDHYINWYLEDTGNLMIMKGGSHNSSGDAMHDNVIDHFYLESSSGGGW